MPTFSLSTSTLPSIRLAFLGSAHFQRDDQPVELNIAKAQALLAYLALTGKAQSREHLLDLLWAESHSDAARKNLRNRLWLIRQTLGEDVLVSEGESISLASSVWSDVQAFTQITIPTRQKLSGVQDNSFLADSTQLQAALDLWRGPLLDGLKLSEAPDFELWLTSERQRLGALYLHTLEQLISLRQADGDWQAVLDLAQRALAYDPTHETMHQFAMLAYAKQGSRSHALRQYDQLRTLLAQELAVEPLPASESLRNAISQGSIGTEPEVATARLSVRLSAHAEVSPNARHPPPASFDSPISPQAPFIGRERELTMLDTAWQRASNGQMKVVLLQGELGIGKTRLWQTWSARLPAAQVVLENALSQHHPIAAARPAHPLAQSPHQPSTFCQRLVFAFTIWRSELLRLAPALQQETLDKMSSMSLTPAEEQGRLAEALTQFLRSFQSKPLLFFIDDLHWADQATLDWLLYLSDRMADEALLLVVAYRPEDATEPLQRLLAQWQREGVVMRLSLPQLTQQETSALLQALGGRVGMANYFHRQSGGNPYYLSQLSGMVVDGIPADLAELVRVRLQQMPAETQQVLQAAAVLEPTIDVEILQRTSQHSQDTTVDALDGLLAASVLVEREGGYEFTHPLVASVVRKGLSSARRKLLHQRAADVLKMSHAHNLTMVAGQLARHYAEADIRQEAAHYAEMAAEQALRLAAMSEAAAFYRQAHQLEPSVQRQLGLGMALTYLSGAIGEARTVLQQALIEFERQHDQAGVVKAGIWLAQGYLAQDEGDQVLYWAKRVLPDLESIQDPILHVSAQYLLGTAKFRAGDSIREAEDHYRLATRLATEHQLAFDIAIMSWFEWGNLLLQQGDYAQAMERFKQARSVAQANTSLLFEALCHNNLAYAALQADDMTEAHSLIDEGMRLANTHALLTVYQYLYSTRGEISLAEDQWDEATDWFQRALHEAEKHGSIAFAANIRANLGLVAQKQGQLAQALSLLQEARAVVSGKNARYLQTQIDLWLTALHQQRGDHAAAEQSLAQAEQCLVNSEWRHLRVKAERLREMGQPELRG